MANLFEHDDGEGRRFAVVIPERALDSSGLTYAIPDSLADLRVGERVVVPLGRGNKPAAAFVVRVDVEPEIDRSRIKAIAERSSSPIRLTGELLELARWLSGYYCCPLGTVLGTVVPAAVKKGIGRKQTRLVTLTEAGRAVLAGDEGAAKVTALQRRALEVCVDAPDGLEVQDVLAAAGAKTAGPVTKLVAAGLLAYSSKSVVRAAWEEFETEPPVAVTLTEAQRQAVEAIDAEVGGGFSVHVLFGVTGSGKTEVYLHLLERCLAEGGSAIVLVPEISLTPQTVRRFGARFPEAVAVLHSGLTEAQRHAEWSRVAAGEARVVVGARSAVFAPLPEGVLRLMIVDEEHDSSYKQDQAPRYHARDVAIKRAQQAGATVVLGSATPALETWCNAQERGLFRWHELMQRVPGATLPAVTIVDLREELRSLRKRDQRVHLIGPTLERALRETVASGRQAMLLLNRRGYANYIACPDQGCGWVMYCEQCDAAMVFHRDRALPRGGYVRCHHCLAQQLLPELCPTCGKRIVTFGLGTQRIEEEVLRILPETVGMEAVLRMDSDTMQRAGDYIRALDRFRRGEVQVLLGTQMIAKGLDFPNVTLVGVVNADTALNLPDFRASERTYQLVAQVAGRSGRGARAGQVIVQTFQPNDPAIGFAARHDYRGFATRELEIRREAWLPPLVRMARLVVREKDHEKASARAEALAERLRTLADEHRGGRMEVFGPAPCPISRISGYWRMAIDVMAERAGLIQEALTRLRNEGLATSDHATAIDVDPVALL